MEIRSIPLFKVFLPDEEILMPRLRDVLYSGQISEGPPVAEFEKSFGRFIGNENTLSFYSGTAALHVALILAGIKNGDKVISTAMTAEPTNMAIKHAGAEIIWADVDPKNGNLSAKSIDSVCEKVKDIKAVMLVHYGGIPASLNEIRKVTQKHGIRLIEDAAHALGAKYNNKFIGADTECTMFSLQAIKHMTTVDGGMLTLKETDDLATGRRIRWFGIDRLASRTSVDITEVGYKYHMNNVNATIGLAQLEVIQNVIDRHVENGKYFDEHLLNIPGLNICTWDAEAEPSYWFYTILAEKSRDLSKLLTENGIANSQVHKRNDQHTVFKSSLKHLPGLDEFYSRMIHIPCGWWLDQEDREYIVNVIKKGW